MTTASELDADALADAEPVAKPEKSANLFQVGVRDLALVLAAISLWAAADTWFAVTSLGFAAAVATLNGLLVGAYVGGQLHEWGHFAGARLSGAASPIAPVSGLVPLFNFDMAANSDAQFQSMSIGGNLAHWTTVLALVFLVPMDTPGRVALIAGAFGFAVFASVTEFPIIRRVAFGSTSTAALSTIRPEGLARNGLIGLAAALAFWVIF